MPLSTESPRVSVIITTHNRADMLPRAVDSVLAQTFQDYEIIIVDDCSTDHTPEMIAKIRRSTHQVAQARSQQEAGRRDKYRNSERAR